MTPNLFPYRLGKHRLWLNTGFVYWLNWRVPLVEQCLTVRSTWTGPSYFSVHVTPAKVFSVVLCVLCLCFDSFVCHYPVCLSTLRFLSVLLISWNCRLDWYINIYKYLLFICWFDNLKNGLRIFSASGSCDYTAVTNCLSKWNANVINSGNTDAYCQ